MALTREEEDIAQLGISHLKVLKTSSAPNHSCIAEMGEISSFLLFSWQGEKANI